jgi:hypothetical protein
MRYIPLLITFSVFLILASVSMPMGSASIVSETDIENYLQEFFNVYERCAQFLF